ncbi:MAG: thiamine pyrophosphate-binding protein [Clostridia bacterium]|nr:thiamine pyrophosphate-binding protein [Clostridia bacterium]
MSKIKGFNIVAKMLKDAGVECVFAITGGHIGFLWPEFKKVGIEVYAVSHESMASYAAMGYAQASGKMGVVIATAGPGVTHAISGIVDSDIYDTPILFIGGASPASQNLEEQLQEYDTVSILKSCTKNARRCENVKQISNYLAVSIRNCHGFNPGPVYLEIPADTLQSDAIDQSEVTYPKKYMPNRRTGAAPSVVEEIADTIIDAKKPVILIGEGVQYGATDMTAFKELAEYLKIPTSTLLTNKGKFFSEKDPIFRIGFEAGTQADVILGFNYATDAEFGQWYINPDAKLISVSTDWNDIGLNGPCEIGVVGHCDIVARQILQCVKTKISERQDRAWPDFVWQKVKEDFQELYDKAFNSEMIPIHPARLTNEYIKFLNSEEGKDFVLNPCGGEILEWTRVNHRMLMNDSGSFPSRFFHGTKYGCIGSQLGALTGVWAATKRPILHVDGDGSFCENLSEVITYAKLGIPVIILISNNSNYEMISAIMRQAYPGDDIVDIANTIVPAGGGRFKFSALSEVIGGYGEEVENPEDIVPALKRAAATGLPSIINVYTEANDEVVSSITAAFPEALGVV